MFKRLLRHLMTTDAAGRRAFPQSSLKAIQGAVARGEKMHRAEIKVMIEPALGFGEVLEGQTSRHRARELFTEYRVWDTEENCGILVYINLADHAVEIIADRGVNKLLEAAQWQQVCRTMAAGFALGRYEQGAVEALTQLNQLLQARLPGGDGENPNELGNRPVML
ncbi:MAG: hypothetical protein JWP36_835 [Paucimonas sp.]|nr:hypothetical protein [Paucimonas sp.]